MQSEVEWQQTKEINRHETLFWPMLLFNTRVLCSEAACGTSSACARSLRAGCGYSKSPGFVLGPPRASSVRLGAFTCLNTFQTNLASACPGSFDAAVQVR